MFQRSLRTLVPQFRLRAQPVRNYSLIDGTAIAKKVRTDAKEKIIEVRQTSPDFAPSLTILQVGARPDSSAYVRMKKKAASNAEIICDIHKLPETITQQELVDQITALNQDDSVHGILVQLPIPEHINETTITNTVAPEKDVDGFGYLNAGELAKRGGKPLFLPCTPAGCMVLLESTGVELKGKTAVVLGRSDIVGTPMSALLNKADATVTVAHRHTPNVPEVISRADIVVAAVGQPQMVKKEWLKPGAVVIDVGINYIPDDTKKSGQRLVGDVDFDGCKEVASHITPVPGGVGPMTVAMLLQNVLTSALRHQEKA